MSSQVHRSDVSNPREMLVDRELSWLAFNQRVLEMAEDKSTPLLERCRFLAIFSSNLDDFYMIRVASLKNKLETGFSKANTAGFTPIELMKELSTKTEELIKRKTKCFHEDVHLKLSKEGINIVRWDELNSQERELATDIFHKQIFPVLTPLAIDPSHPFPYISGLSLNLAVIVKNPDTGIELFARVKVPSNLARFVVTSTGDDRRYIPLEQVITANIAELFPGMEVLNVYTFRITRNADLELEEEESEDKKPKIPVVSIAKVGK